MAKILVVDDTTLMRRLLQRILEMAGYEVVCAVDGQEGLDKVAAEKPDLVIMDWNMPKMNGLEALRVLRADPATRSLPVLMISAASQDADITEMQAMGTTEHVSKPFQAEELLAIIRQNLESGT